MKASAASAAEHENLQTAFVAAQQALVEARSDLQQTEAAHAASKAELEARVSNALSKSIADEAQSQALRERNASLEQQLALATKLAEARNQSITPPPTIAVRSPSCSKSPASSNSRWHSGSASRSSVPPSPGGSAGSSSKQRSRLARVKTGATPRQSPRPGVGFGSRSDRGLSPARRGSLSSSGTPGTPGSVERRSPRLWCVSSTCDPAFAIVEENHPRGFGLETAWPPPTRTSRQVRAETQNSQTEVRLQKSQHAHARRPERRLAVARRGICAKQVVHFLGVRVPPVARPVLISPTRRVWRSGRARGSLHAPIDLSWRNWRRQPFGNHQ